MRLLIALFLVSILSGCSEPGLDTSSHQNFQLSTNSILLNSGYSQEQKDEFPVYLRGIVMNTMPNHLTESQKSDEVAKIENWDILDGLSFVDLNQNFQQYFDVVIKINSKEEELKSSYANVVLAKTVLDAADSIYKQQKNEIDQLLRDSRMEIVEEAYIDCSQGRSASIPCSKANNLMEIKKQAIDSVADQKDSLDDARENYQTLTKEAEELEAQRASLLDQRDNLLTIPVAD